ncbi:MAG: hypothetical protein Q7R71_01375 [bacterium]|nr:hypothetical protein [bacterium]
MKIPSAAKAALGLSVGGLLSITAAMYGISYVVTTTNSPVTSVNLSTMVSSRTVQEQVTDQVGGSIRAFKTFGQMFPVKVIEHDVSGSDLANDDHCGCEPPVKKNTFAERHPTFNEYWEKNK